MIYNATQKGPFKVAGYHDPDDKRLIGMIFKPYQYSSDTVYSRYSDDEADVVVPTVFTGFYYSVKNPGKSDATTEPTWIAEAGAETSQDGTSLVWEAHWYNLMPLSESITDVAYTCSGGVTISNESFNDYNCQFMIDPLDVLAAARTLGFFEIKAHCIKSNSEEFDITLYFKLAER